MRRVVVAGAIANRIGNGGGAWVRLSWLTGLERLGYDVHFLEVLDSPATGTAAAAPAVRWFQNTLERFHGTGRATLLDGQGDPHSGLCRSELLRVLREADLIVNLGGHLRDPELLAAPACAAFVDLDPGYTQIWHQQGVDLGIELHHQHYTIAANLGSVGCPLPTAGVQWRYLPQPVVLADWPMVSTDQGEDFTTVASWRGAFGPVQVDGVCYGPKAHEFRKLASLPTLTSARLRIALDIHEADAADQRALLDHGWILENPRRVAGDPARFRDYVARSLAELSVAQGIYAATRSGWFSDRSVRYLASGRPVVVQDTGFASVLPAEEGILPFSESEEARSAIERVRRDYRRQAQAARTIAEDYFDHRRVLLEFLHGLGVPSPTTVTHAASGASR